MRSGILRRLYALTYCVLAACVGTFVGAVAGVGVAAVVLDPEKFAEEGAGFLSGICLGAPIGAIGGFALGTVAVIWRSRANRASEGMVDSAFTAQEVVTAGNFRCAEPTHPPEPATGSASNGESSPPAR